VEVLRERLFVDGGEGSEGSERLRFGSEGWALRPIPDVQRLLPEAIPGEDQGVMCRIDDRRGEHAVEPPEHLLSPFGIPAKEDFGVRSGREPMSAPLEGSTQRSIVVDLAVHDEVSTSVLEVHRLRSARDVDDGEAGHPQVDRSGVMGPEIIRTAMDDRGEHPTQCRCRVRAALIKEASDATHRQATMSASRIRWARRRHE
jgi:hypothetical protein